MLLEDCTNIVVGTNLFDFSPNIERNTVPRNSLKLTRCEQCTLNGLHIVHAIDEAGLLIEDSKAPEHCELQYPGLSKRRLIAAECHAKHHHGLPD